MISFFRRKRRGIVGTLLVGMCVVLMLPFGLDYFGNNPSASGPVVKIDDKEISAREFDQALYQYRSLLRRQFGDNFEKISSMINIKQKVLDELIDNRIIEGILSQAKLEVGVSHIEAYIRNLPIFGGDVTRDKFVGFLKAQGITERQLQEDVKKAVLRSQLEDLLSLAGTYSPKELDRRYKLSKQELVLSYAKIVDQTNGIAVSDDEVRKYFDQNKSKFLTEKEYAVVSIKMPYTQFVSKVSVHEEDLQDAYKKYANEFTMPAKAELEQLILNKKAPDFLSENVNVPVDLAIVAKSAFDEIMAAPDKFAEIAKSKGAIYNVDAELKEVSKFSKEIQQKIKDLNEGEISQVLDLSDAYYIIRVKKYQPSFQEPFEKIKPALEEKVRQELVPDLANFAAEELKNKLYGKNNEQLASELKSELDQAGYEYKYFEGELSNFPTPEAIEQLESKAQGEAFVLDSKDSLSLFYLESVTAPKEKSFELVAQDIKNYLLDEKKAEQNKKYAKEIIAAARNAGDKVTFSGFQHLSGKYPLTFTDISGEVSKISFPFLPQDGNSKKIISTVLTRGLVAEPIEGMDGSIYLILLKEIQDGKAELNAKDREAFIKAEAQEVSRRIEELLLIETKKKKNIEINEKVLELIS